MPIVTALVKRLGQESVIQLGLKTHTRLTTAFAQYVTLAMVSNADEFDAQLPKVSLRLADLFEDCVPERSYGLGGGEFLSWKSLIDKLIQSRFPTTRALAYIVLTISPPSEGAIRDRYTRTLLADSAPEMQAIARTWPWLDNASRSASLSAWLSKQPRAVVLDAISDLQRQTLTFNRVLLNRYSKSSDPQIAEMARLTLAEALQGD